MISQELVRSLLMQLVEWISQMVEEHLFLSPDLVELELQWNLRIKDTLGSATLSSVERLSFLGG